MTTRILVCAVLAGTLGFARNASADLDWMDCYGSSPGCHQPPAITQPLMDDPMEVVVSPDRKAVFVAGMSSDTLLVYNRAAGGALQFKECFVDTPSAASHTDCTPVDALENPRSVAVAPDNNWVYVASTDSNSIISFRRDPATNHLTEVTCMQDSSVSSPVCPSTYPGISGIRQIAIPSDGKSLYAAGHDDHAITSFRRVTYGGDTGQLLFAGCLIDYDDVLETGCTQTKSIDALHDSHAVAFSSTGATVYVGSAGDNAVTAFHRDPATSLLTFVNCVSDSGSSKCGSNHSPGLAGARSVAVSNNDHRVYVAGSADSAIAILGANSSGALVPLGKCIRDDSSTESCPSTSAPGTDVVSTGLKWAHSIAVDPITGDVYAAGRQDSAVAWLHVDPVDGLVSGGVIFDDTSSTCTDNCGLNWATSVAVTNDGASLYVNAWYDDSLVWFDIN